MGEPERLLEWALGGDLKSVHFSDGSAARCERQEWIVTAGSDDNSEAADFVMELIKQSVSHCAMQSSPSDGPSVR